MSDFFVNTSKPVFLNSNMLNFRDTNKFSELSGDLPETMTKYDFNVDHSNPQDRKKM